MTTSELSRGVDLTGASQRRARWGDCDLVWAQRRRDADRALDVRHDRLEDRRSARPAIEEVRLRISLLEHLERRHGRVRRARLHLRYGDHVVLTLLIAAPIAIAIGLFLSELAPKSLRSPVGAMVETLAGIPSVLIGLWGIIVLGPIVRDDFAPVLDTVLGWTPFFAEPAFGYTGSSMWRP